MSDTYDEKSDDKSKIRDRIISTTPIIQFGDRLKEAMNGMTNVELAKRTGMSEATIRKYIAGKILPAIDSVAIVAEACGVSFSWLAFGEGLPCNNSSTKEIKDDTDHSLLKNAIILDEAHSSSPEADLINLVQVLDKDELERIIRMLKRKGVEMLTFLDDEISIELLQLPEHYKIQLLTKYRKIKEGASEGDQDNDVTHPTQNQVG